MITLDLIEFIKLQLNKNISKETITTDLSEVGWRIEDIEEGFAKVEEDRLREVTLEQAKSLEAKEPIKTEEVEKVFDKYRELPIEGDSLEEPKLDNNNTDPSVIDTPFINILNIEKEPTPAKIWVPTAIQPKIEDIKNLEIKGEIKPEIQEEISKEKKEALSAPHTDIEPYMMEVEGKVSSINTNHVLNTSKIEKPEEIFKPEEKLTIQNVIPNIDKTQSINIMQGLKIPVDKLEPIRAPIVNNGMTDIIPKSAIISSYSQDILSANIKEPENVIVDKKKSFLKWGILIILFIVIFGMIFAFVEGYIKIPGSKFSFFVIKKDPRVIVLNSPDTISSLKAYKVETSIGISFPSLSNITTGLSSGDVVKSSDTDFININNQGFVNHTDGNLLFDYPFNIKSSLLKNDIVSDLKYDGTNLFVSVPDLSQILQKDAPDPTTVSIGSGQLGLLIPEFSPDVQDLIKKIDIYNILGENVPLYVKNETFGILKDFITGLTYTDKGTDTIHGVDTYHYELITDNDSTKKFLSSLTDLYIAKLPDDQKQKLDEAVGSSTISSFDVWVGKNDDNLYQIQFTLDVPLSKVLGLNDSGIAGNEVKLDWKTTYYDLDVLNSLLTPKADVTMEGFVNKIKDIKTKNIISAFKAQATSFHNATGSFGIKPNINGSCTNPNPGSLFSPQGHAKGADGAVGAVSSSMDSLLSATDGAGACYSTSSAWALSAPLMASDPTSPQFYCIDSKGGSKIVSNQIKGTVCL